LLSSIGKTQWVAKDEHDYVRIAKGLAGDLAVLAIDKLSDEAKAQLASIQFCDQELARLQAQSAALQTARMAYAKALQSVLPAMPASDTIKFN
jgi:hypothetical protein